jgi:thiosulfate reductase cytochrome b subunit
MTTHSWFMVVWWMAFAYVVLMFSLGWRLNVLREQKRARRDTPNVFNMLDQVRLVFFLFQGEHRQIGDPLTSTFVVIGRVLFVAVIVGMGAYTALPTS